MNRIVFVLRYSFLFNNLPQSTNANCVTNRNVKSNIKIAPILLILYYIIQTDCYNFHTFFIGNTQNLKIYDWFRKYSKNTGLKKI